MDPFTRKFYSTNQNIIVMNFFRVPTTSGNQRKLEGILPVREKSGNVARFFFQKSGNLMTQYFFSIFDGTIHFDH